MRAWCWATREFRHHLVGERRRHCLQQLCGVGAVDHPPSIPSKFVRASRRGGHRLDVGRRAQLGEGGVLAFVSCQHGVAHRLDGGRLCLDQRTDRLRSEGVSNRHGLIHKVVRLAQFEDQAHLLGAFCADPLAAHQRPACILTAEEAGKVMLLELGSDPERSERALETGVR